MQDSYHWDSDKTYIHVELTYKPMKDWTHSIYEPATRHWSMSRMSRSCENFPRDHGLFQYPRGPQLLIVDSDNGTVHTPYRRVSGNDLSQSCDDVWRFVTWRDAILASHCQEMSQSPAIRFNFTETLITQFQHSEFLTQQRHVTSERGHSERL